MGLKYTPFFYMLNEHNLIQCAMKWYDNSQCHSIQEFELDFNRPILIQKLFHRYVNNNELNERLILNHIIILHNVFGEFAIKLLFYKIDNTYRSLLITFLVYLNYMPDTIPEFNIITSDYMLDPNITTILRNI